MCGNGLAIFSTGLKILKYSVKYIAKAFNFVLFFLYKSQIKRFGGLGKNELTFGLNTKPVLNIAFVVQRYFNIGLFILVFP